MMQSNVFVTRLALAVAAALLAACQSSAPVSQLVPTKMGMSLSQAVNDNPARAEEKQARDNWRNPEAVLEFCGVEADKAIAEIWPSGGWWTEILAPYLRDNGTYYAATPGEMYEGTYQDPLRAGAKRYQEKLAGNEQAYGKVVVTELNPPRIAQIAPDGQADVVLTFRNLHNFMAFEIESEVIAAANRALKPGGILCVVDHRGDPEAPWDPKSKSGYVQEQQAISLIEPHGFKLVERSEVNANPRDTRNHPSGVWTLPPRLAKGDEDREKYLAIGESDRFTLKFRKISDS